MLHLKEAFIMECVVQMMWDDEADVWVATSEDVPGLVMESGSYDALVERVRHAIPELLELNAPLEKRPQVIKFVSERRERMAIA